MLQSCRGTSRNSFKEVVDTYYPDRIIIEPTGVGKLSDIIAAVQKVHGADLTLDRFFTVVDAKKCKMYHKNFGEFFNSKIGASKLCNQAVHRMCLKKDCGMFRYY